MIGGRDIILELRIGDVSHRAAVLDFIVQCIYGHWQYAVVQNAVSQAVYSRRHYREIPFGELPELMVYRDALSFHTFVHILNDPFDITIVVDDDLPSPPFIQEIKEAFEVNLW